MVKKITSATDFGKKPYARPIIREVDTETTSIIAESLQAGNPNSSPKKNGTESLEEEDYEW